MNQSSSTDPRREGCTSADCSSCLSVQCPNGTVAPPMLMIEKYSFITTPMPAKKQSAHIEKLIRRRGWKQ